MLRSEALKYAKTRGARFAFLAVSTLSVLYFFISKGAPENFFQIVILFYLIEFSVFLLLITSDFYLSTHPVKADKKKNAKSIKKGISEEEFWEYVTFNGVILILPLILSFILQLYTYNSDEFIKSVYWKNIQTLKTELSEKDEQYNKLLSKVKLYKDDPVKTLGSRLN